MFGLSGKKGSIAGFAFSPADVIDFPLRLENRLSADCKCMQTVSRREEKRKTKIDRDYVQKSHFSCFAFASFKELRVHKPKESCLIEHARSGASSQRTHFNNQSNSAINNIKTLSMPNERENAEKFE